MVKMTIIISWFKFIKSTVLMCLPGKIQDNITTNDNIDFFFLDIGSIINHYCHQFWLVATKGYQQIYCGLLPVKCIGFKHSNSWHMFLKEPFY